MGIWAAADQQGEHGAVALPLERGRFGAVDKGLGLRAGEPVPCPDALLFDAGDLVDRGGGFGVQPAVGGSFARQFLHGRQALVDGGRRVAFGFQCGAVGLDGGAVESRIPLLRPPGEEVVEGLGVHGSGGGARDGIEDQALDGLERNGGGIGNEAHQTGSTQTAQASGASWASTGRWTRPVGCSARRRS